MIWNRNSDLRSWFVVRLSFVCLTSSQKFTKCYYIYKEPFKLQPNEYVKSFKYLGVIIGVKLEWNKYISHGLRTIKNT
jgi:hypothetical protein